ncbi:MAG: heme-copper oxidase subunit III [Chloroflexi bacterium]|nr:heme-copper oxidase subunit III [Chloroflexota bacterium]
MSEMTEHHGHDEIHVPGPSVWPLAFGAGFIILAFGAALNLDVVLKQYNLDPTTLLPGWLTPVLVKQILTSIGGVVLVFGLGGWLVSNIRDRAHGPSITPEIAAKMGMWIFLGSEVLFFTGLISTFLLLRARSTVEAVEPLVSSIPLVSLNTFILLTSSLTVVLAHDSAARGKKGLLNLFLLLTVILGATFVSLQGVEYTRLYAENLTWTGSGLGTGFFTLTGFHGLHVIIGVIWCLSILPRALRGGFTEKEYGGVEIFGLYWHFVDIVWILLFTIIYLMH